MYEFNYHRATSAADAGSKASSSGDAIYLAGGQTLIPVLKHRLAGPNDVIDLGRCSDLAGIIADEDGVKIGAMTRHVEVADAGLGSLSAMAGNIGDQAVRNRGTIGGSIANNDPAADYPAACLALKATIITDQREIAADDFFTGLFETALREGEIITAVKFPRPQKAAYMKFPNPASRYAIAGVYVAKTTDGIRVAVTGAGENGVFRCRELEKALSDDFSASMASATSVSSTGLLSDIHAGADYRAHLISVLTARAVDAC